MEVQWFNASSRTAQIYWRDYQGARQLYATLAPWQLYTQATFLTHPGR